MADQTKLEGDIVGRLNDLYIELAHEHRTDRMEIVRLAGNAITHLRQDITCLRAECQKAHT
jgi:hypothetical protein